MAAIPKILYKYVDLAGAEKILFNNTLKATPPNKFNDPFELMAGGVCNVSREHDFDLLKSYDSYKKARKLKMFDDCYARYIEHIDSNHRLIDHVIESSLSNQDSYHNEIAELVNELSKTAGIVCFSATNDHILMWSHYADQHKGVVIGFDSKLLSDDWIPVDYSKERYFLNIERRKDRDERIKMIARKSDLWAYEEEYRFVVLLQKCKNKNRDDDDAFFTFEYRSEAIKEVIFGCRMSRNNINDLGVALKERYGNSIMNYKAMADKIKYGINLHKTRF